MDRISIITICYNNLQELTDTCLSVEQQTAQPFEHLIIDGSSESLIKDYLNQRPQPAYRRWINERDKGISDAFNKGIKQATGNILVMLNAGDTFYDEHSLQKVIDAFASNPQARWLHAKYMMKRGGQDVVLGKPFEAAKVYRGMRSISHQTMYVRKELFDQYGLFDTSLKIPMDYDFLIRIRNEPFYFLPQPIVRFAPQGISSTQYLRSLKETSQVYRKYFGNTLLHSLWQLRLKGLYYLLNSPVGKALYKLKVWLKLENM
ncbi:glycosyltransferase [Paraflavitalea soli]|uniref:Glycosyltransferase n=1 Tax=Paraflavitalea soli TaxID=2315862 RepID=A0A3B7MIG1_9BACT|nr:glycosyltransferase family 2 protein [Paraflavitalea soli]AXY73998.1 glycosyltransferase [Paraflavitalea soli]